jgi:uncharacterized protein (TIRG00374 family)
MSIKVVISWVTLGLLALIIFLSRHELVRAWQLLESVNIALLLLLIPCQLIAYYAAGETVFSYLTSKGKLRRASSMEKAQMALELNFVNHALPSGGVSGLSYMTWRLSQYDVRPGRATSALMVRYVSGFIASIILVFVSVFAVTIDGGINRWIILVSCAIVAFMVAASVGLLFVLGSRQRMRLTANWCTRRINWLVRKLTRGKRQTVLAEEKVMFFLDEIHEDYLELRADGRLLIRPVIWAIIFTAFESMLFVITFWALGTPVNPGPVFLAYLLASVAGFIVVTPGGAGAYEAIMVAFLATAGISSGVAIAGIVLTRVIVLLTTIVFGYAFYQRTIMKYGNGKPAFKR